MKGKTLDSNLKELSSEEVLRIENEARSNLRYSWQKAMSFAIAYKPTIQEVLEELETTFMSFIPQNHQHVSDFRRIIIESFQQVLGKLFQTDDVATIHIENEFIEIAILKLRDVLFHL